MPASKSENGSWVRNAFFRSTSLFEKTFFGEIGDNGISSYVSVFPHLSFLSFLVFFLPERQVATDSVIRSRWQPTRVIAGREKSKHIDMYIYIYKWTWRDPLAPRHLCERLPWTKHDRPPHPWTDPLGQTPLNQTRQTSSPLNQTRQTPSLLNSCSGGDTSTSSNWPYYTREIG